MKTMRAVCIYAYGGPEVLVYEDAPCPRPRDGEVLIRVHAAGINPIDWKIREGRISDMIPQHVSAGARLGCVGRRRVRRAAASSRLAVGDEVFSRPDVSRDGAYAEYIVVKESEVALKPKSRRPRPRGGDAHGRADGVAIALRRGRGFDADQRVLIHGAAGGVGHLAVQLAKWTGATSSARRRSATTISCARSGSIESSTTEGAFRGVGASRWTWFSTRSAATRRTARGRCSSAGGILVSIAESAFGRDGGGARRAAGVRDGPRPIARNWRRSRDLVDVEKLKAIVETILPLSDATRGQELSERGHVRGKIVLRVIEP